MKKILIIRPSSIGDIVMASPLIGGLRHIWPESYISWLADPSAHDILAHNPNLDEVVYWSKQEWRTLLHRGRLLKIGRTINQFAAELRRRRFDLAIDAQGLFRSRLLAWLSGAGQRIGFESREPGRFFLTKVISRGPSSKDLGSEYFYLLSSLGHTPARFQPEIILSEEDLQTAAALLRQVGIGARYAVICPFTTRPQKLWFDERWAELAARISRCFSLPVILLGGPGDVADSQRIQSEAADHVYNLTGKTTLGQAAAIVRGAALITGVDTGLTHMGSAFQCPTIALFGATCPYLHTASRHTAVLYDSLPCSPCKRTPTCRGEFNCMRAIDVTRVMRTARQLLDSSENETCAS
jgi:heptosyltransferase-1